MAASRLAPERRLGEWVVSFDGSAIRTAESADECSRRCSLPPAAALDGREALFDGVLYDSGALAGQLGAPNSASAPELLLASYARWGADLWVHLRGVFTALIVDTRSGKLLGARDPLGMYPLFYARSGRCLYLSNSVSALVRLPGVSGEIDRIALVSHLRHHWNDPEGTYFKRVRRVPPGHAMQVEESSQRVYRYWDPVPVDSEPDWVQEPELERFDELFRASCSALYRR